MFTLGRFPVKMSKKLLVSAFIGGLATIGALAWAAQSVVFVQPTNGTPIPWPLDGSNIPKVDCVTGCGGGGAGTVTEVDTSGGVTGGPITTTGTVTLANLAATSHQWLDSVVTGSLHKSQPAFTDISGTAAVTQGGTGATTLGANGVVLGEGSAAVHVTAAGTAGDVLTSNGAGVDPTFQAAGGGGGDTITSPGSTITVGGTSTNTTLDVALPVPTGGVTGQVLNAVTASSPVWGSVVIGPDTTAPSGGNGADVTIQSGAASADNTGTDGVIRLDAACNNTCGGIIVGNFSGQFSSNVQADNATAASNGNGLELDISGGNGDGTGAGGALVLDAGSGGVTGAAGDLRLQSGIGQGTNNGGTINIFAQASSGSGDGGQVNIVTGNGGAPNGNGGGISVTAGNGSGTGSGGNSTITSGDNGGDHGAVFQLLGASAVSHLGGSATIASGEGSVGGGAVSIIAGAGDAGPGGDAALHAGNGDTGGGGVTIFSGAAGSTGQGGQITIQSGNGGDDIAGVIQIIAGGSFGAHDGPAVAVTAGNSGAGATGNGGAVALKGGDSAAVTGNGGAVTVHGGNATGTDGDGGTVALQGGSPVGTGGDGQITLTTASGIFLVGGGTPGTPTSCGIGASLAAAALDMRGTINVGAAVTACTLPFSRTYANAPICVATAVDATPTAINVSAVSTSSVTFAFTSPIAAFNYICLPL